MSRFILPALALFAVLLAGVLAWELQPPSADLEVASARPRADVAVPAASSPAASDGAAVDHPSAWARTALARPLFRPGRRPPEATPLAANAGPSGLPRLTGVMIGPFGKRAIFAGAAGKPVVLGEGGQLGAYVLQSIEAGAVTVTGPEGRQVIRPSFDKTPPPPASRPGPPRAGSAASQGDAAFRTVGSLEPGGRGAP